VTFSGGLRIQEWESKIKQCDIARRGECRGVSYFYADLERVYALITLLQLVALLDLT
jgi:hypothetical protein